MAKRSVTVKLIRYHPARKTDAFELRDNLPDGQDFIDIAEAAIAGADALVDRERERHTRDLTHARQDWWLMSELEVGGTARTAG